MTIFVNGKQKQVRRQSISDAISQEEFIERNADPIWLQQNEMWEYIKPEPPEDERCKSVPDEKWDAATKRRAMPESGK